MKGPMKGYNYEISKLKHLLDLNLKLASLGAEWRRTVGLGSQPYQLQIARRWDEVVEDLKETQRVWAENEKE